MPDHGENLQQLSFNRAESWLDKIAVEQKDHPVLAIGHAGWINAAKTIATGQEVPNLAINWPHSVGYLSCSRIDI